jgi:hypothetical protein
MVVLAFAHCGAYLVVAAEAEKDRRKKKADRRSRTKAAAVASPAA